MVENLELSCLIASGNIYEESEGKFYNWTSLEIINSAFNIDIFKKGIKASEM